MRWRHNGHGFGAPSKYGVLRKNHARIGPIEAHLVDCVALARIVDAHLRGGGCAHHARSELPDAPQVLVHRGVTQFGVEWNVRVRALRLIAVVHQAKIEFVEDRRGFAHELPVQFEQILGFAQNADRRLDLPARFERDGDSLTREPDEMIVLPVLLRGVVVRAQTAQQFFHAVRLTVRDRRVVGVVHGQMFDLHAEPPGPRRGAPLLEEADKAAHVPRVRLNQQVRVGNSWCCHKCPY